MYNYSSEKVQTVYFFSNINDAEFAYTDSIKYLGAVINGKFNDNAVITRQLRCVYDSSNTPFHKICISNTIS